MPHAAGLAAELKTALDLELTLVPGSKGAFEITVDGNKVYSKHETGRFPQLGEIPRLIRDLQASNRAFDPGTYWTT